MKRIFRIPVVAVIAMLMAFAGATAASAHDVLESTSPADGSSPAKVPHSITLTFDKPAESIGTTIKVKGPAGDVPVSKPKLVNTTVTAKVGGKLPAGSYTVNWRVTSADGHPVSGTFSFTAKKAATYDSPGADAAAKAQSGDNGASSHESHERQAPDDAASSTSQSSGSVGTILIVAGVALVVVIIIVIAVVTLRRRRPLE